MKFDLSALKAYIGGLIGTWGLPFGAFLIAALETSLGFDIPSGIESIIASGVNFVFGSIAVYFTSNQLGKPA